MFNRGERRITSVGFPHSGIRGSQAIQRLPAAYRSRSRPSSTLGAKASSMRPYYLDGDLAVCHESRTRIRVDAGGPVIPVCQPRLSMRLTVATVQFSRVAEKTEPP